MNYKYLWLLIFMVVLSDAYSQSPHLSIQPKGKFYVYWGYNRGIFSKSTIHASGAGYDYKVMNAKAKDHAENPSMDYVSITKFSIPQFNVRAGYYIKPRWAISFGYDHMKYVMTNGQTAKVTGVITAQASEKYAGAYLNQPMIIEEDFLKFEHTDGLNVITVDLEHYIPLWTSKKQRWKLDATAGTGGFAIVPRSDVRVLGKGRNNKFHLAGYTWTGKAGLRINGLKRFFFQFESRGGFVALPSVLVDDYNTSDRAKHYFSFLEFSGVVGVYF